MGTTIRAKLSTKNPYWITKHRYYELKHFCLQYSDWEKAYLALNNLKSKSIICVSRSSAMIDSTMEIGVEKNYYMTLMNMVENAAKQTDKQLATYILTAVTEGWSYDILKARLNIPCCRDTYYSLYRRFFWILSRERQ